MRQRFTALTRALPAAQKGDPDSLHQARVATRRLREALPLLAQGRGERKLERTVRRLTQALGPVRELDVSLQILDDIEASAEVPRSAVVRLRRAVLEERHGVHKDMLRRIERCNIDKLRKRTMSATRKRSGKSAAAAKDPEQIMAAMARAARRAERLQLAIDKASALYLPDRLHEVRIAVKKLRYAVEIVRAVSRSRAEAQLNTLKKAQDVLGRMHDLEVLIARTRTVQGSASAPNLRLSGELDRLVRRMENECRQLHGHYIASRKSLLTLCDQVVGAWTRRAAAAA
jgi:CHAD domain-containing protein